MRQNVMVFFSSRRRAATLEGFLGLPTRSNVRMSLRIQWTRIADPDAHHRQGVCRCSKKRSQRDKGHAKRGAKSVTSSLGAWKIWSWFTQRSDQHGWCETDCAAAQPKFLRGHERIGTFQPSTGIVNWSICSLRLSGSGGFEKNQHAKPPGILESYQ